MLAQPFRFAFLLVCVACASLSRGLAQPASSAERPAAVSAVRLADGSYDVRSFGAAGDGRTKDTAAIQRAIDSAHAAGGGTVRVPAGVYLSGTLFMKDHVTIHLDNGTTLLGSTDIADYPKTVPEFRSYTDNYVYQSLLYGENVHDVSIVGEGAIDGQGKSFPREHPTRAYGERPYLIRLVSSRQIRVAGITLRDSPMWVQHYLACDRVTIDGITVHSLVNANNDGIDIDCCSDVRIANCSITSGDDAIVLKSTGDRACKNVTVSNCVLSTRCNGLKLGTESNGNFEDITFSNCVLHDVRLAGIALEMVDGGVLQRVAVSNITMNGVGAAIFLRLGNRARPYKDDMPRPGMGQFRDVKISHVIATVAQPTGCALAGLPDHPLEDVSLSDITLVFPGGRREAAPRSVPEVPAAYPEYRMFGPLPAYGFYCRHVRGLSLSNIDVRCVEPDSRPAYVCDDVHDLTMLHCRADDGAGTSPVVVLRDVEGAFLQGCTATAGTGSGVRFEGKTSGVRTATFDLLANPVWGRQ